MEELTEAALDFGGANACSGASTSRTLMLRELSMLLAATSPEATIDDYHRAIVRENVLLKPSVATRDKTYHSLRDRFGLDREIPIFRMLRLLWDRDQPGQPLMALLIAAFRDPALRSSVPAMIDRQPGQAFSSREFAQIIDEAFPGVFTAISVKTMGQRMTSTYRQSGHLFGRGNPVRHRVQPTPGSTTVALLIATLQGRGGWALLDSDWVRLLDGQNELVLSEARIATSRGWLEYRRAGDVLDITFHQLFAAIGDRA